MSVSVLSRWVSRSSVSGGALALVLGMGWTGAAAAQDRPAGASEADGVTTLADIVVTAQKRAQRLSEVPMAVTAYGSDFLEKVGITKFDELAAFTPGLTVQEQSANNAGFVVRGVTTDSGSAQDEPRVAIFYDGVSASRNRGAYMELFDLDRVEVVKGPQATLFGRAALIGGINVIQHKADVGQASAAAELGVGSDGYYRAYGMANLPLATDKLALRLAATVRHRDGWVENLEGGDPLQGAKAQAYRGVLTFRPAEAVRFDLIVNHHHDDNSGTAFKSGTFVPAGGEISPYAPARLNRSAAGFEGGAETGLNRTVNTATLLGDWRLTPAWTLSSISGWRKFDSLETNDPDGSSMPFIQGAEDARGEQWSQELRLRFDDAGPLSGFAGVSYLHEKGSQRLSAMYDERYALALLSGLLITTPTRSTPSLAEAQAIGTGFLTAALSPAFGAATSTVATSLVSSLKPNHYEQSINYGETDSLDVYGDLTWKPVKALELTAGVRWTKDDKTSAVQGDLLNGTSRLGVLIGALGSTSPATQRALLTALLTPGAPLPAFGLFTQPQALISKSGSFDGRTYRLVGRYQFTPNVSVWASFAHGRRPDVISLTPGSLPGTSLTAKTLPAEEVDSFEVGTSAAFLNGRLRLNGSIYDYDYANFQTQKFDGGKLVTINAGKAKSPGAELQATWRPSEALELFGTYAYSHARFSGGAYDGDQFRLAPDHSVSLGAAYSRSLGALGVLSVLPTYTWRSKVFFDDANDRRDLQLPLLPTAPGLRDRVVDEYQDAYGLLNLRVRLERPAAGPWAVEVFATNLLNKKYLLDAGNTGDSFTFPTFVRGAPRLVGVSLSGKF
ncbi:TonB-dependent receptor [Caulobacter sp.]|uniref:TonB-dependent receptor n=1 Tax=Caulobacter sp. TaxID=78 RepID=UPI003BAD89F8